MSRRSVPFQYIVLVHHIVQQVTSLSEYGSIKTSFCKAANVIAKGPFDSNAVHKAIGGLYRVRREAYASRGRYRGQTQSQYLAIDHGNAKDDGKAEAHSDADSSRASVSEY